MPFLRETFRRLCHHFERPAFEAALDDEIRFHLETRTAELMAEGLSARDAQFRARREFGSVARMQEGSRATWTWRWLTDFAADFRLSLRGFRRSPGFAITAVLSLGLGIGATSAIFTTMDAALWRPLAVDHPERLVLLGVIRALAGPRDGMPSGFLQDFQRPASIAGILTTSDDGVSFAYDGRAERIVAEFVSPNYFEVLSVAPYLGQHFTPGVRSGAWAPEVVLSYRFWQRRFGGDPSVIGHPLRLNTVSFIIVGVSPPTFYGPMRGRDFELRVPRLPPGRSLPQIDMLTNGPDHWTSAMARLAPGATVAQAEAAVDAQLREFLRTTTIPRFRSANVERAQLLPGAHGWTGDLDSFSAPLYTLLVLVGIVLLIACANLAGMLIARATARSRELAIRCSIGAGRGRLVRQMLAESLALATLGGIAGIALSGPASRLLFGFLPQGHVALALDLGTEGRTLLFTFAITLITGVLFGLAPALQSTRGNLAASLKSAAGAGAGARTRAVLVAGQVAFSVVLLVAAGASARTLAGLRPTEYSRAADRILCFTIKPQQELYSQPRLQALAADLLHRIGALPGVHSAAMAENGPFASRTGGDPVMVPGGNTANADTDLVTPGFFETVGIARVAGRDFTLADREGSARVIIVNQTLARMLYPNESPVGRTLTIPGRNTLQFQIVGVVEDTHYYDVHGAPKPAIWLPGAQKGFYMPTLLVRFDRHDTGALMAEIRREFDASDRGFPIFNVRTFEARIEDALSRERMVADFSGALGVLALLMAAVGLYGVLAYAVTRRTREIGIRMALGSNAGGVIWLVARDALGLVAAGGLAGTVISLVLARVIAAAPAMSAIVVAGALGAIVVIAAAAATIPAARASRVNPVQALRCE